MGRFPQTVSSKGSKKWIQKLVNEKSEILNNYLRQLHFLANEEARWLSPRKEDDYAEYRDQDFINTLGIELKGVPLSCFWPRGGPQWDALGKSSKGKLFLVEAKSHIPEIISTMRAKDDESMAKIRSSLEETRKFLRSKPKIDWTLGFYQYTNRLAHLYLLRKLNNLPAYLIFIYFINDREMNGPSTIGEWKAATKLLNVYMGTEKHILQKSIGEIFIDVNSLRE